MKTTSVLMVLPNQDFDPTEAAITWQTLVRAGYSVVFATENGQRAHADPIMLHGRGLDPWAVIPFLAYLKFFGLFLRAQKGARQAYLEMSSDPTFLSPYRYTDLIAENFDALVLPGGHAKGMRQYLENKTLQDFVAAFFETKNQAGMHKPIAAVCHGVLLAARSISASTGKSVLYGKKTTALTWQLEKSAWRFTRFFGRFWDPTYYRTYSESAGEPTGYWGVEQEVKRALQSEADFMDVPKTSDHYVLKSSGIARDNDHNSKPAWVVKDGNYLSARWPGDVHTFAKTFVALLDSNQSVDQD